MKAHSPNYIAFDLGSNKIAALAAHIGKQGDTSIIAQVVQQSMGIKSGIITDMVLAENSIVSAVYALEKYCDKSIKEVSISLSGHGVKSYYVTNTIKLGAQPISELDVKKLISKALSDFKIKNMEVIHYFPIEYKINNDQNINNPIGLTARELFCQIHIIAADSTMVTNLTRCLAKCHLEVNEIYISAYSAGMATLTDDEKELGALLIDLGANTSSYGIFLNGKMIYTNYVPVGSFDITVEIAKSLSVTMKEAEKIKILYGITDPSLLTKDSIIKLENGEHTITASWLAQLIYPQIKFVLESIKKQCDSLNIDHMLAKKVVITGGGSSLANIKSMAAEIFHKQVRVAKPTLIPGLIETANPSSLSTVVGIVLARALKMRTKSDKYEQLENVGLLKKVGWWIRDNI